MLSEADFDNLVENVAKGGALAPGEAAKLAAALDKVSLQKLLLLTGANGRTVLEIALVEYLRRGKQLVATVLSTEAETSS